MTERKDSQGEAAGEGVTYAEAGVDVVGLEGGLGRLLRALEPTAVYPRRNRPVLPNGFFANVLDLGGGRGLAIGTDGVGTKLLVAHALRRYDTLGIDLVAMNANDVLCVGAEPIALVDYVAVPSIDPVLLEQLAIGLAEGARQARISIPGGEIAQVREVLRPHPPDGRESFELVGTAVGVVDLDRLIVGRRIEAGDAVIALPSSGIHSNGLTLARRVLAQGDGAEAYAERPAALGGKSIGEELLEPTRIYVAPVMHLLDERVDVRALAHITGDGLLNLLRVDADGIGFVIDDLPEPPAVMRLIAERGEIPAAEMYQTFNMGVGFCIVVAAAEVERALSLLEQTLLDGVRDASSLRAGDQKARVIGRAVRDPRRSMVLPGPELVGSGKTFWPA